VEKTDPYRLPARQIWTDGDLAKWSGIAFVVGLIIGTLIHGISRFNFEPDQRGS
jgi:hypothetical protein